MAWLFANSSRDLGSIQGRVVPKIHKMVFDVYLLDTQHYKARTKSKWNTSRKGAALSPISWCCRYWKESLQVALDYVQSNYLYVCVRVYTHRSVIKFSASQRKTRSWRYLWLHTTICINTTRKIFKFMLISVLVRPIQM